MYLYAKKLRLGNPEPKKSATIAGTKSFSKISLRLIKINWIPKWTIKNL